MAIILLAPALVIERVVRFVIAFLLVTAPAAASPSSRTSKLDHALLEALGNRPSTAAQPVIIEATNRSCIASLKSSLQAHGDFVRSDFSVTSTIAARVHTADLLPLADAACVSQLHADADVLASGKNAIGGASAANPLRDTLGLSSTSTTGTSIGIAILDSGILPLRDFGNRITAFYDFTAGGIATSPNDAYGHGTHVAGIIAGDGSSGTSYKGIAPNARLIGLKVLDNQGRGETSDVISALDFAAANKTALGISVINLSLGHPIYEPAATDPLVQAVERATRAGIVVIVAAGNFGRNTTTGLSGYTGITSPANSPSALTVGALETADTVSRLDDRVAYYSSKGPTWFDGLAKPDLLAPGSGLISLSSTSTLLYQTYPGIRVDSSHIRLSGTSMAAAVATGIAALVLEASTRALWGRPPLTSNALKAVLQYTAFTMHDDLGFQYDALTQGAGGLNAGGAIALASRIDTTAAEGQFWLTSLVDHSTTIDGQVLPWSDNILWGSRVVRGSGIVDFHQAAWAQNLIWGDMPDDNIVWGSFSEDNIVWGSNTIWTDDNIVWGSADLWGDNIVWGSNLIGMNLGYSIVWGSQILWDSFSDDNIVWGSLLDDNIVWGSDTVRSSVVDGY